ncbi:MAG TPA: DUF4190 domain-containing protein [Pyrinomonadaceae bacterium]|jgi:hypothetical protein|nr:DUF4190 domain-containing protein [Pyrinomonadaceae bacterium]
MKYCPQCNRQYTEVWLTFCSDDGSLLIEELSPPVDPNWDPKIREPNVTTASEQETQWLPREAPMPPAWVAPDERPPMSPMSPAWQPPPPPPRPRSQQSQTLAVASMVTGILGLVLGCLGPLPGIAAVVLGWMALSQIKKNPYTTSGKPMAIVGVVTGGLTIAVYSLFILWIILAAVFGS